MTKLFSAFRQFRQRHRPIKFKNEMKQQQLPTVSTTTMPSKDKYKVRRLGKVDDGSIFIVDLLAIDYPLVWSRALASCSILMLLAEGVNLVTGSMIVLISVIGIFGPWHTFNQRLKGCH